MSCSCHSNPCRCQCAPICPEVIEKNCENANLAGVGVFDGGANNIFYFRGVRSADSSLSVVFNPDLQTIDISFETGAFAGTKTFANAATRSNTVPEFLGQLGIQQDTLIEYTATGLTAGAWALTITNGQPLNANLTGLSAVALNGLYARTGAATATTRTIGGGASMLVTNGDGVAGNPTLSVIPGGIDKNLLGGTPLSQANGGTGAVTGYPAPYGTGYASIIADYTVLTTDCYMDCNPNPGSLVVTLPDAALFGGRIFRVKKRIASLNTVTVAAAAGDIDGVATDVLADLEAAEYQSDGADWWIMCRYVP